MDTTRSSDAVSPVVGVILVVAITVALSGVVGVFVFDLEQSVSDSTTQSDIATRTSYNADGTATVQVVTGEADELRVLVNGTEADSYIDKPSPGDSLRVTATTDSSITIISHTDGESTVVSTSGTSPTSTTPEQLLIDSFNDSNIDEYDGELADFSIDSSVTYDSSPSVTVSVSGGASHLINSTDGLNAYPQQGDTIRIRQRWNDGTVVHTMLYFGGTGEYTGDSYRIGTDAHKGQDGNSKVHIGVFESGSYTEKNSSAAFEMENYNNEWITVTIDWGTDGTIVSTWTQEDGTQLAELAMTNTSITSGGIGFHCNDSSPGSSGTCWFDTAEIER